MACGDYDDDDDCNSSGVAAWVIVLIVVLILKAVFWTVVCYRYYRRRQLYVGTRHVTVATVAVQSTHGAPQSAPRGQVAYSGPMAGHVPTAMPVHSTNQPHYPPGANVPPPYNPHDYKPTTAMPATAPPAYGTQDDTAPLL